MFGLIGIFPVDDLRVVLPRLLVPLPALRGELRDCFGAHANGGGVAFFAHVGGFVFGLVVARALVSAGRVEGKAPALGARA